MAGPATTDPAAIAQALTFGERLAVLWCPEDGAWKTRFRDMTPRPPVSGAFWHLGAKSMVEKSARGGPVRFRLTPLGQAVRKIVAGEVGDG